MIGRFELSLWAEFDGCEEFVRFAGKGCRIAALSTVLSCWDGQNAPATSKVGNLARSLVGLGNSWQTSRSTPREPFQRSIN
jgi:hypothetical protein